MKNILSIILLSVSLTLSVQSEIKESSIESLWNEMVFEKGGCLGGKQHFKDKQKERPTLVFSEDNWKIFSKKNKKELTDFLINKLADTSKTKIHTCPFMTAKAGEFAVYSLQKIHKINWYDFPKYEEYASKEPKSATDQPQVWLWNILENEEERNSLAKLFKNKLKE